ncbi:MAG: DNA polymerase III subunit alpha, partial [Vallitaleaceae bacterium]|nr:DNA polymerase III subunit alpha [Vallitaleaceae bacterium]
VAAINQREDLIHKVDFDELDYDDAKTFELIASGKTEGVFQLESEGMKNFMKDLKPQNIEDIIAGISLYRPGPMSSIPDYVRGRHHAQEVRYLTKELEEILKPTYGCIVYQEQVMQIVRDLAGYTLGRSDLVRRAMSKKKADVMNTERQNFIYGNEKEGIKGCVGNGIAVEAAEKIFNDMEDFAKYAFNKSHAAAYAIVAYQTAWLKCYYPVEFMAALITSVLGNPAKTAEYVSHLREMGIDLLPPDINEGFSRFTVKSNKIRFGLAAIKNVGKPIIDHMVAERQKNGPFLSMTDFCIRMEGKDVNKRVLESLIKAGAFDSLGATRLQYMQGYKNILDSVSMGKKNTIEGQLDLFALGQVEEEQGVEDHLPLVGEFQEEQLFANEKEVLGIYVSGHPLMKYEQYLAKKVSHRSYDFKAKEEAQEDEIEGVGEVKKDLFDGQKTIIGGLIRTITRKLTRQNANMAFVEMEDMFGTVELVVFPKVYEKYANLISEDRKIIVQGRVNVIEDQDAKVIVEQIKEFEEIEKGEEVCGEGSVWLRFKNQNDFESKFPSLQRLLYDVEIGKQEIIYYIEEGRKKKSEAASYRVTRRILEGFIQILGEESVKIVEKS